MVTIAGLDVNVLKSGQGRMNILLLHGWGQSTKAFEYVQKHLETFFTVYNVDLPGFGLSEVPKEIWGMEEYAHFIKKLIDYYKIEEVSIIGHSFGGRVAIKYTSIYNQVKKLVLVDSAGIVQKKKLGYYIKVYRYKFYKRLFSLPLLKKYKRKVLSRFGSTDYKNANEMMRKILVRVVNEDLTEDLKNIMCPTLLVWGTDDQVTPFRDAEIMDQYLHDSGIVRIENAGHFSYLEDPYLFSSVLDSFFKGEKKKARD